MEITLNISVRPFGKQRPRMTRTGHAYTPQRTRDYESIIKSTFQKQFPNFKPFESPLLLDITFFFIRSKSNKSEYHIIKPDLDNLIKSICDALNGIAYIDDRLIISLVARKEYSRFDGISIKITELEV